MAKIYIGNTGYKLSVGNNKIKKGYLGNILVYSGDIGVTYHVDDSSGLQYTEIIEEGYNCLSPTSFNPEGLKPGYTFLGWRSDTNPSPDVYHTLIAGSDPIDLYAVYYIDYTVNFYNASTSPVSKNYRAYYNNGNDAFPASNPGDLLMSSVSGFENSVGWTDLVGSHSQLYNNDTIIPEIKSNMSLYSIYSKNINVYVVNGSNSGAIKSTVSGTIYRQYSIIMSTENPTVNLKHNLVTDWDNGGWNFEVNSTEEILNDGINEIPMEYNGKTIYALYKRPASINVINGSDIGPVKQTNNGYRYRQYNTSYSDGYNDIGIAVELTHNTVTGFNTAGWNTTLRNYSSVYSDGVVNINSDSLTIYALYVKDVSVTVYNGYNYSSGTYSPKKSKQSLSRYRQYNTATFSEKHPTVSLSLATISNWAKHGWNIEKNGYSKTIDDNIAFEVTSIYDGCSFYALYKQDASLIYYNGVNIGSRYTPSKQTFNDLIVAQFNDVYYKHYPSVTLTHSSVSGWTNNGWSISSNPGVKLTNDCEFTVDDTYNGKTLYALYKKSVTMYLYNVVSDASAKTTVTKDVIVEYRNDYGYYNPTITLKQNNYSGWTKIGWSWSTESNGTTSYSDGTFTITKDMDGKILNSGYKRSVTVRWYNNPSNSSKYEDEVKYHYRRAASEYPPYFDEAIPTFKKKITAKSGWIIRGWVTSSAGSVIYCADNTSFSKDSYGDNPLILSAAYYHTVTLKEIGRGTTLLNDTQNCYYSSKSGEVEPAWFDVLPQSQSGKTFLGWSKSSSSTTVMNESSTYFRYGIAEDTTLYAVWKNDDKILINNTSGNNYECPFATGNKRFVTHQIGSASYNDYDYVSELDITTRIEPGKWATGTWSYQRFYPGSVPKNYIYHGTDVNDQPNSKYLRGVNWQSASGHIETDEGPCANNVRTVLTNIPLYETDSTSHVSNIYVAFLGDMESGSITIYKLKLRGRTVVW